MGISPLYRHTHLTSSSHRNGNDDATSPVRPAALSVARADHDRRDGHPLHDGAVGDDDLPPQLGVHHQAPPHPVLPAAPPSSTPSTFCRTTHASSTSSSTRQSTPPTRACCWAPRDWTCWPPPTRSISTSSPSTSSSADGSSGRAATICPTRSSPSASSSPCGAAPPDSPSTSSPSSSARTSSSRQPLSSIEQRTCLLLSSSFASKTD